MSMGYMPKKQKFARRQRRMRKKYKNFSCITCDKNLRCRKRIIPTPPLGLIVTNFEFCPEWVAAKKVKKTVKLQPAKRKKH